MTKYAPNLAATGHDMPLRSRDQTMRLAWLTLLVASAIWLILLLLAAYGAWSYRTYAMKTEGALLFVRTPAEFVRWQRKSHTIFEQAHDGQRLEEGERISVLRAAGYGQAATVRLFDTSTIDMWANADLVLTSLRTSQWNTREQRVVITQHNGYVRYDIRAQQPYRLVSFRVLVGDASIDLTPGGSYSIDIRTPDRRVLLPFATDIEPNIIDIAVRSGQATVEKKGQDATTIAAGQRVLIDTTGTVSSPRPAQWELIRDNWFGLYNEQEYNNTTITDQPTLPRARSWQVFSGPASAVASGFFKLSQSCPPPDTDTSCDPQAWVNAAWFIRQGGQTTSFTTGVYQRLGINSEGVDISEYRTLVFSAWVRVLAQSIDTTGEQGTECPVMIRFLTKDRMPTDPEEERVICVYTSSDPTAVTVTAPGVTYYRVEPYAWYHLAIDLRDADWLPEAHYMRSIEIYANGHDYDSRITGVSLLGSHSAAGEREHEGALAR